MTRARGRPKHIDRDWVPLIEGVRILARQLSGSAKDNFEKENFQEAAGRLERAGREASISAEGVRYLDYARTPLLPHDWMSLRIYQDNRLDDPFRSIRARPVRITQVVVDANDVRHLFNDKQSTSSFARDLVKSTPSEAGEITSIKTSAAIRDVAQIVSLIRASNCGEEPPGAKALQEQLEKGEQRFDREAFRQAFQIEYPHRRGARGRPRKTK